MIEAHLRRVFDSFVPATEADLEEVSGIHRGEVLKAKFTRPRNLKFHRKFFALLHIVFQNQFKYATMEHLLTEFKLQAGLYEEYIDHNGRLIFIPKSISFAKMDDLQFAQFYSKALDIVFQHFIVGGDPDEIDRQVNQYLNFC